MFIKENQPIIISVDFSELSIAAIKQGYELYRHLKSKLILAYIHSEKEVSRKSELDSLVDKVGKESLLEVEGVEIIGNVFEQLSLKSKELSCSLIVLGLNPNVRHKSLFGASDLSKFIKHLPCPIITLRSPKAENVIKNIILPVDLTAETREKVPIAVQIAKFYGAEIRIVSVFSPNNEKEENELLPYLNQIKKFVKEKGVNCTNKSIPTNNPAEAILDYAEKNNGDLIIQMNKKDLSISEMLGGGGTISIKIIELSKIPVLSINPMERLSIASSIH